MSFYLDYDYDPGDYSGGGYSSDHYTYNRLRNRVQGIVQNIGLSRSTYIKDGRVHSGDHADKFIKCLHGMFLSSNYCDVTLVTNTATFKAHKVVLAANSAYFNAMFSSTCSEALQSVVSFKDNPFVTSTGLSAILEYAYLGSFNITHSSVREIMEVARHLLMDDVTKYCERFIQDITINPDNYVGLFETAREFGVTGVEEKIEHFFKRIGVNMDNLFDMINFTVASKSDVLFTKVVTFISQKFHYLMCSKELLDIMNSKILLAMVKADGHGIFTDMSLINFIVKWVETSPKDRLPVLPDVIKEINLLCFEVDALDKIADMPFIKEDEKVKEHISEAKSRLLEVKERSAEDDLYVVNASGGDLKFHSLANESVITKKAVLDDIQSRIHHRQVSISSYDQSVIAVGDILFFIGGPINLAIDHVGAEGCPCFSYDPARNVWKEHASLPSSRRDYRLVASEGEVYAIGGRENYNATNRERVDVYNFTRDEWRTETPLPRPLQTLSAAALTGSIYVYSYGDNSHCGGSYTSFLKYDQDMSEWAEKSPPRMLSSRYDPYRIGRLLALKKGLYHIASNYVPRHLHLITPRRRQDAVDDGDDDNEDVSALRIQFYDETLDHWEYSTFHKTFGEFHISTVLSHMDDMYIIASYRKKVDADGYGTKVSSLFKFNEASRNIELLKDDFPLEYCNKVALVSIPKASIARLAE